MLPRFRESSRARRRRAARSAARRTTLGRWVAGVVKSTAFGTALVGGIVLLRAVGYRLVGRVPTDQADLGEVIGWAALAGGVAGFAYGLLGAPLRRRRPAGPYLAGLVAGAAYAIVLVGVLIPRFQHVPAHWDAVAWISIVLITLAAGLALGWEFAKEDAPVERLPNER